MVIELLFLLFLLLRLLLPSQYGHPLERRSITGGAPYQQTISPQSLQGKTVSFNTVFISSCSPFCSSFNECLLFLPLPVSPLPATPPQPEELTLMLIQLRRQQAELSSLREHTVAQLMALGVEGPNAKVSGSILSVGLSAVHQ